MGTIGQIKNDIYTMYHEWEERGMVLTDMSKVKKYRNEELAKKLSEILFFL